MSLLYESHAAAIAVLGFDLAAVSVLRQSANNRRLVAGGMAGSAAALDAEADVFIGREKVGTLFNTSLAAVQRDDMFRLDSMVPAGVEIRIIVTDAATTNPLQVALDLQDF